VLQFVIIFVYYVYYIHCCTLVGLGQKHVECTSSPVDLLAKLFWCK